MAFWQRLGLSGPAAAIGIGIAILLIGGAYLITQQRLDGPPSGEIEQAALQTPETPKAEPEVEAEITPEAEPVIEAEVAPAVEAEPAPEPEAEPEAKTEADSETESEAEPEAETEQATAEPDAAPSVPETIAPAFDLVRVDPQGGAVIAGTGAPGNVVRIVSGEEVLAEATIDRSGNFVALFDLPHSDTPRSLAIESSNEAGETTRSSATVLIAANPAPPEPEPEPEVVAQAELEPAPESNAQAELETPETASGESTETATTEPTPEPEVVAEVEAPAAPSIVLADEGSVQVLQPAPQPQAPGPKVDTNVVIDTITYDTEGAVALAGRGNAQGFVRLYLDGRAVRTTSIEADGSWNADLPDVDAGVYTLRIDEVDADGAVTSRVETPFQREEAELVARTAKAVTVQPGFTLWAIAEGKYGAGEQYVRVYEANRDLIRDPDLIYPGQIFTFPEDG